MKYTLFSDPHSGTRRAAHTTRDSSKALTEALYQQALHIANNQKNVACLGDLFDRAFNDEATLVQGTTWPAAASSPSPATTTLRTGRAL